MLTNLMDIDVSARIQEGLRKWFEKILKKINICALELMELTIPQNTDVRVLS